MRTNGFLLMLCSFLVTFYFIYSGCSIVWFYCKIIRHLNPNQTTYHLYVRETWVIIQVVIIISAVVVGSVSIVYFALKELIKAVWYWIWIAKIQIAIQDFVHGFIYTYSEVLLLSKLFVTWVIIIAFVSERLRHIVIIYNHSNKKNSKNNNYCK